jgi:hypothetical protein
VPGKLDLAQMPERNDLAAVIEDDGAIGEMIRNLGNPG